MIIELPRYYPTETITGPRNKAYIKDSGRENIQFLVDYYGLKGKTAKAYYKFMISQQHKHAEHHFVTFFFMYDEHNQQPMANIMYCKDPDDRLHKQNVVMQSAGLPPKEVMRSLIKTFKKTGGPHHRQA